MAQATYSIPGTAVDESEFGTLARLRSRLGEAVLILEGAPATERIRREAFEAGVAHHPLIDFRARPAPECDITVAGTGEAAVSEAEEQAATMLERLAELPALGDKADSTELQVLGIAYLRNGELLAAWGPDHPAMIAYPQLAGLADPRATLDRLADADLLSRRLFDRLHQCSRCGSSRLNVREECPACRSGHLREESLIHHYRCAHQGPEQDFRPEGADGLLCPKCHRSLRHYGVDYDRPASVLTCIDCGETASDPVVGFVCADCGSHTDGIAAEKRPWYHYELTGEGRDALFSARLPMRSLADSLRGSLPGLMRPRDFDQAADLQMRIAKRYNRPISGLRLEVRLANGAEESSSAERERAFRLVGEIVGQTVRECDPVKAEQDIIKVLMPETSADRIKAAEQRIRARLAESISETFTFSVETSGADGLLEFLA